MVIVINVNTLWSLEKNIYIILWGINKILELKLKPDGAFLATVQLF